MNKLLKAGLEVENFCHQRSWKFCFIGAIAVQRWGEPRLTQDLDLTVITGFGSEEPYVDALLAHFQPRSEHAKQFALEQRVLLLSTESGIPIDISLGAMPFEERAVKRASPYKFAEQIELTTCGADDLVVLKAFANRDKDWVDLEGILIRQMKTLNWNVILEELSPLVDLKEEPEILEKLRRLREKVKKQFLS